jgi:purine-binding chemotaxis protein CheW
MPEFSGAPPAGIVRKYPAPEAVVAICVSGLSWHRVAQMREFQRTDGADPGVERALIVRVGALQCALPLSSVVETMRPLPLQPLANTPDFVSGASIVRGQAVPVVDLARLLGVPARAPARIVLIRAHEHDVALAVDEVIGLKTLTTEMLSAVPSLLSTAASHAIEALGTLDMHLLLVLRTAHLVPDSVWPIVTDSGSA